MMQGGSLQRRFFSNPGVLLSWHCCGVLLQLLLLHGAAGALRKGVGVTGWQGGLCVRSCIEAGGQCK